MANAAVTASEIEELRLHLGYGNLSVPAETYTPTGFLELFTDVIAANLGTAPETFSSTAVSAEGIATIAMADATGITSQSRLYVDVGDDAEWVVVRSVSGNSITCRFAKAHTSGTYPVLVSSGVARLRNLLHRANAAWEKVQSEDVGSTAGIQSLGRGEIVWFPGGGQLSAAEEHYESIVEQLSSLVRVLPAWGESGSSKVETY